MNALLLPGNSPRHAVWIEELNAALSPHFGATKTQHYRHWSTGQELADITYEITVAQQQANNLDPYVIIAKSIGTVIAVKGTAGKALYPEKLILLGVPLNSGVLGEEFEQRLQQVPVPVVIAQNTADPIGSFSDVKGVLEGVGEHVLFVELPDDTHDYLDFEAVKELLP